MIKVILKDGSVKEHEKGTIVADVIKGIGAGLYKASCCAVVDGNPCDLRTPLNNDCQLEVLTFESEQGKKAFWHTTAHILAAAVKRLYPNAKPAIGPAIDQGFYYDFDVATPFTPEDLDKIQAEMVKIVKEGNSPERFEHNVVDANELMKEEPYKLELIAEHSGNGEALSFYKLGEFVDLCAGPHIMDVSVVKAVKLIQCTAAYWRADASKQSLCRVYGISFPKASELSAYLEVLEEAKKRDHRKLGKELELFTLMEEGPGFPFFLPKGMELKNALLAYWREAHKAYGYKEVSSPIILNKELWITSGHWLHYRENMYTTVIDDMDFAIKPMNCPGAMLIYKTKPRSYRDLPLRMGEIGLVHRHELSGALHGLMRVRNFSQDDAHIFMLPEQIKSEIAGVVSLIDSIYKTFGFQYHIEVSTRPEDSMGSDETWEKATSSLMQALTDMGYDYKINEGDGAFYGPKIDFKLQDCLGRTWQCGTVQLDFQMPERFELEYIGEDGEKHRPVMIHRVAFGSIERFIGILIEHFAGAFPLWLAPVQVKVLPISEKYRDYAEKIVEQLEFANIRVEIDHRAEKIGYKIREAQLEKIPYMLIVGEKEMETSTVSVRSRKDADQGSIATQELIEQLLKEIKEKA